jgi:hypothetical protein
METLKIIHAIAGTIVGIVGLVQILLKKNGPIHRYLGIAYVIAWFFILLTGAFIGGAIITMIGALGFYMVLSGYRFAKRKKIEIDLFDKIIMALGCVVAIYALGWGVYMYFVQKYDFGIVVMFLGGIFTLALVKDVRHFWLQTATSKLTGHKTHWIFEHYGRMYVSYIAALTAFSAIQQMFDFIHPLASWILPTFIGTGLIILTNQFYYKKFNIK